MSDEIVGFNRLDADALLGMIEGAGGKQQSSNSRPIPIGAKWGRSKTGGLGANAIGSIFLQVPTDSGWANGPEVVAWNRGSAIGADKLLIVFSIDGRFCVSEFC